MNVIETDIPGVLILEPRVFGDARGYFFESYNREAFREAVGEVDFVQDNESRSSYGVVRGLHFQKGEWAQAKLVRVVEGCVLDVAVDLRPGSPTYGRHVAVELSGENHRQLFIPRGFAHGFYVMSYRAVFAYKCTDFYHPNDEGGILYSDPEIGIKWPFEEGCEVILSEKDRRWAGLTETIRNWKK